MRGSHPCLNHGLSEKKLLSACVLVLASQESGTSVIQAAEPGPGHPPVRMRVQSSACRLQNRACGFQHNACGLQSSACGVQDSAGGLQSMACGLQDSACGLQSSAFERQDSACGPQSNICGLQNSARGLQHSACGSRTALAGSRTALVVSRTAPVGYPAQQHCEAIVLASIFGGRHGKPLKPDETVHETAWQVCETGETGVLLIKN